MKKSLALVLVLTMLLTFAAACSGEPAPPAPAPAPAQESAPAAEAPKPAEAAEPAPAPEAADEPAPSAASSLKMVWYFPAPHPYGDSVQEGVKKFELDTGITVTQQVGADWTQATQNEKVEALAAQGMNALLVYPADGSGANALYEELTNRGVKIVSFGTSTLLPTTASFAVATDVKKAAYDACEYVIKQMGEKGNILNVLEVLTDPNTVLRKEGIEECVAKYPDVKIIQEVAGILSPEEAVDKIESALSANVGNIQGIVCTGFTTTVGVTQVLSNYYDKEGKDKKIYTIGIDTDPIAIEAIQNDILDATIAQNPIGHGYIPCSLLRLMVEEGYKPKDGVYFIDSGAVVVTKDNIDTYQGDIDAVTADILSRLTTDYLEK